MNYRFNSDHVGIDTETNYEGYMLYAVYWQQ